MQNFNFTEFKELKERFKRMNATNDLSRGSEIDKCFTDLTIKLGGGVILGTVFSLLLFKRRSWPIVFGSAFGTGVAYRNCCLAIKYGFEDQFVSSLNLQNATGVGVGEVVQKDTTQPQLRQKK